MVSPQHRYPRISSSWLTFERRSVVAIWANLLVTNTPLLLQLSLQGSNILSLDAGARFMFIGAGG